MESPSLQRPQKRSFQLPPVERIKVISIGEQEVGKTSLIKRYCEGRFFHKYLPTIGVDFGVKPEDIDGHRVKVNLWDLSGKTEFFEVRNEFYKDTHGVLLVFDMVRRETFDKLGKWLLEANKYGAVDFACCVCGNKADVGGAEVSEREATEWAQARGFRFFTTSAKEGLHVDEAMRWLFRSAHLRSSARVPPRVESA